MKKIQKKSLGMVFGTFDLFHKGHEFYIREAKKHSKNLIAVIARNSRVLSGKWFFPHDDELLRRQNVENFLQKNFLKKSQNICILEKILKKALKKNLRKQKKWKNFEKKSEKTKIFKKILKKIRIIQKKNIISNNMAILGDEKNIFLPIEKYQPEILFFGYDQKVPEEKILEKFPNIHIMRIKSFRPDLYKSSILREKLKK